jgi:hypothetical protein
MVMLPALQALMPQTQEQSLALQQLPQLLQTQL